MNARFYIKAIISLLLAINVLLVAISTSVSFMSSEELNGTWINRYTFDVFVNGTHRSIIHLGAQVFWNGSGWRELNFENHYATDGYYLIQNSHITAKLFDWYTVFSNPDNEKVCVDDERWIVEVYNEKTRKWREVDLYNPTLTDHSNVTHLIIRRTFDTSEGTFEVNYILWQGSLLKHEVTFKSNMEGKHDFRVIMKLSGIVGKNITTVHDQFIVTEEKHLISPFCFVGENLTTFREYLWSLGILNASSGEWTPEILQDIVVDVHAKGCKIDIIIGTFPLLETESLFIDPDSDTFTPPTKDSYVSQASPDANFGSGTYMYVRSWMERPNYKNNRALVEFDISDIPVGSTIDSAELRLYARYSSAAGRTYQTARITGAWTENGVTWNNKPAVTGIIETTMVAANNWFNVDVTSYVAVQVATGVAGFRVRDKVENSGTSKQGSFCTKEHATSAWRPQLYVEWTPVTKVWNDVSTWNFNLTGMQWQNIATWSFDLIAKGWNNIAQWSFTLVSSGWHTITYWTLNLSLYDFSRILFFCIVGIIALAIGVTAFAAKKTT